MKPLAISRQPRFLGVMLALAVPELSRQDSHSAMRLLFCCFWRLILLRCWRKELGPLGSISPEAAFSSLAFCLVAGSSPKRQGDARAVWQLVDRFIQLHERRRRDDRGIELRLSRPIGFHSRFFCDRVFSRSWETC
jgi:hypothetical protein